MDMIWTEVIPLTPLGLLTIKVSTIGIRRLAFGNITGNRPNQKPPDILSIAVEQVMEYLAGKRQVFTIPVDWSIFNPFAAKVLRQVAVIPYGKTASYGEVAQSIGSPGASRAVGSANAKNPIPIIIPCHRVISSSNHLQGYNGPNGIETKAWLLVLEGHTVVNQRLV